MKATVLDTKTGEVLLLRRIRTSLRNQKLPFRYQANRLTDSSSSRPAFDPQSARRRMARLICKPATPTFLEYDVPISCDCDSK